MMLSFRKSLAGRSNNVGNGGMAAASITATRATTAPRLVPTTPTSITTATTTAMTLTNTPIAELENVEAISPLSSSSSESVPGKRRMRSPGRRANKTKKSSGVKVPFYRLKSFKKRNNAIAPPTPTTTAARIMVSSAPSSSTSLSLVHRNHNNILISNMVRRSGKWSGRSNNINNNNNNNNSSISSRGVKKVVQLKQPTSATATQQQRKQKKHVIDGDENSQAKNAIATSTIIMPLHSKLQTQDPIQQSSLSTTTTSTTIINTTTTNNAPVVVNTISSPIINYAIIDKNDDDYEILHLENECTRLTQQITQLLLYRADRKYTQQYYDLELKLSIAQHELAAAREDRNLHFSHHSIPNSNGDVVYDESKSTIVPINNTTLEDTEQTTHNAEEQEQITNNNNNKNSCEGGPKKKLLVKYQQLDDELITHPKFSLSWFRVKEELHDLGITLNDYLDEEEEEGDTPREINICVSTSLGDLMTSTECTSPLTSPYSPSVSSSLVVENDVYGTTTTTTTAAQSPRRRDRHRNNQRGIFTCSKSPPASPIHLMKSLSPPLPSLNAASSSCNTEDLKSPSAHSSPPCSISSGWSGGGGGGPTHQRSSSSQSPYHKYESRNIYCMSLDDNDDDDRKCQEERKKGATDMEVFKDARIQAINILKAEESTSTEQLKRLPVFSKDWFDVKTRLVGLYDQITRLEKSDDFDISSNSTNTNNYGGVVLDSSCDSGSPSTTTGTKNDQSYISGWSSVNDASSCAWSESEDEILSHVDELDLSMVTEALKYREEDDTNSAEEDAVREDTELLLNPSSVVGNSLERHGSNDSIIDDSTMLATHKVDSILDDFSSMLYCNHTTRDGYYEKQNFYAFIIQEQWRRYIRQDAMIRKKEIHAATTIQSHYRKSIHCCNYRQQVTSAIIIQTLLRKHWLITGKFYIDRREVVFHSSTLGLQLERGRDGFARILSVTEVESSSPFSSSTPVMRDGKIIPGDLIVNACRINVCRPMTVHQWVDIIRRIRSTPRPMSFVVVNIPSKEVVQAAKVIQSRWRKGIDQCLKTKEVVQAVIVIQCRWRRIIDQRCHDKAAIIIMRRWRKAIDQQISSLYLSSSIPIPEDKDAYVADNPRVLSLNSFNTSLLHKLSPSKDTIIVDEIPLSWEAKSPIPKNMVDDKSLSVELEATEVDEEMPVLKESEFPADQSCVTQKEMSHRDMNELSGYNNASKRLQLMQQEIHIQAEIIMASSDKKTMESHVEMELEYHHDDTERPPNCDENHDNSTSTNQQPTVSLLGRKFETSKLLASGDTDDNDELIKPQLTSWLNAFPPQTVSSPENICEKTTSVGRLRQLWEGKKSSPLSLNTSASHVRYEMNLPANHKQQNTAEISRLLKANVERKLAPELKMKNLATDVMKLTKRLRTLPKYTPEWTLCKTELNQVTDELKHFYSEHSASLPCQSRQTCRMYN